MSLQNAGVHDYPVITLSVFCWSRWHLNLYQLPFFFCSAINLYKFVKLVTRCFSLLLLCSVVLNGIVKLPKYLLFSFSLNHKNFSCLFLIEIISFLVVLFFLKLSRYSYVLSMVFAVFLSRTVSSLSTKRLSSYNLFTVQFFIHPIPPKNSTIFIRPNARFIQRAYTIRLEINTGIAPIFWHFFFRMWAIMSLHFFLFLLL